MTRRCLKGVRASWPVTKPRPMVSKGGMAVSWMMIFLGWLRWLMNWVLISANSKPDGA